MSLWSLLPRDIGHQWITVFSLMLEHLGELVEMESRPRREISHGSLFTVQNSQAVEPRVCDANPDLFHRKPTLISVLNHVLASFPLCCQSQSTLSRPVSCINLLKGISDL